MDWHQDDGVRGSLPPPPPAFLMSLIRAVMLTFHPRLKSCVNVLYACNVVRRAVSSAHRRIKLAVTAGSS